MKVLGHFTQCAGIGDVRGGGGGGLRLCKRRDNKCEDFCLEHAHFNKLRPLNPIRMLGSENSFPFYFGQVLNLKIVVT